MSPSLDQNTDKIVEELGAPAVPTVTDTTTATPTTDTDTTAPCRPSVPPSFRNASVTGEIPSFNGDEPAQATDFANYFCSYAQLYHQKQMLADHHRMAAYHAAILGNADVFRDKVVMDVGTGSGILAVWAAQAGAKKVYAIEYTDMAKHAKTVMKANNVSDVVTVIQAAVESVELPIEQDDLQVEEDDDNDDDNDNINSDNNNNNDGKDPTTTTTTTKSPRPKSQRCVDIIISEWMGYFLLRESMMDSLLRARDRFLKPHTGIMLPSHVSLYIAPIADEDERKAAHREYASAMSDWRDFCATTQTVYGVDMTCLDTAFEKEQHDYYLLSSCWTELPPEAVLCEPKCIQEFNVMTCTLEDARGITAQDPRATFCFDLNGTRLAGPISGLAGWFVADFQSRTDDVDKTVQSPRLPHAAQLSTAPDQGYTHWGQQTFYFPSSLPLLSGEATRLEGRLELMRTVENARLYNCRITYTASRRKLLAAAQQPTDPLQPDAVGPILMKSGPVSQVYQIP
ncbi:hypothetical protein ACA910_022548 [Epithemia clementina (nom. ined.)]